PADLPAYPPVAGWVEMLTYPFSFACYQRQVMEVPCRDLRLAMVYGLLLLVGVAKVVAGRPRATSAGVGPGATAFVGACVGGAYGVWQDQFGCLRSLCPVLGLAPLAIVLLLPGLLGRGGWAAVAAALLCFAVVAGVEVADYGHCGWMGRGYLAIDVP